MRFRPRLTYANVVATLALFVALGGTAVAAHHFINGATIKPGSEPGNRIKKHTITGTQLNARALPVVPNASFAANAGTANSANTAGVANNALTANSAANAANATNATNATNAANLTGTAWGRVLGAPPNGVDLSRSHNATASRPARGVYCISVPGVSPLNTPIIASIDHSADSTVAGSSGQQSFAEVESGAPDCPSGQFEILAFDAQLSGGMLFVEAADDAVTFFVP